MHSSAPLAAILIASSVAVAAPLLVHNPGAVPNTLLARNSPTAKVRDAARSELAGRPQAFNREPLGARFAATPARLKLFLPCRATQGPGVDGDGDGLVDNLIPENHWRKDWSAVNPEDPLDPNWTALSAAEQAAAIRRAKRTTGVGSTFGRGNERADFDCDLPRDRIPAGPLYRGR